MTFHIQRKQCRLDTNLPGNVALSKTTLKIIISLTSCLLPYAQKNNDEYVRANEIEDKRKGISRQNLKLFIWIYMQRQHSYELDEIKVNF